MVLVCHRNARTDLKDLVELVSVHYALKRVGGPIVDMNNADFSQLQSGQKLYIVGHGSIGKVGQFFTIKDLVDRLKDRLKGLVKGRTIDITFTSCSAGQADLHGRSTVSQLRKGLEKEGYTGVRVQGAVGSSVKADVTGTQYAVVDPARGGDARKLQDKLFAVFRPKERLAAWLNTPEGQGATLQARAQHAATISQQFYTQFTAQLKAQGLLKRPEESILSQRTSGRSPKITELMKKFGG